MSLWSTTLDPPVCSCTDALSRVFFSNDAVGRIAAGKGHDLEDVFVSNIREYVAKMHWPDVKEAAEEEASGRGRRFWG